MINSNSIQPTGKKPEQNNSTGSTNAANGSKPNLSLLDRMRAMMPVANNGLSKDVKLPVFAHYWLTHLKTDIKESTACSYESAIANHICRAFPSAKLSEITADDVQLFIMSLTEGIDLDDPLSPKTIRNVHGVFHRMMQDAYDMVYCADCGKKMYLCRATSLTADQEHLKCSTYSSDKDTCSAHFIRTVVLNEIVLNELNKLLVRVKEHEDEFVQAAMDNSVQKQSSELTKAKKALKQAEKRITELDRLFTRLYEDNVSGKISDERFAVMSEGFLIWAMLNETELGYCFINLCNLFQKNAG